MLFNANLFDSGLFDGGAFAATTYSADRVVFNTFSLSDGTVMILQDLLDSGPSRDIIGGLVPRGDGQYITASYFRERIIEARGIVVKSSAATLEAYMDTIRSNLRGQEGNLDITDANGTAKRFIATVDNFEEMFSEKRGYNINICPWRVRFKIKTPFGKSRNYTSYFTNFTVSGNQSVVNSGTYKAQPVFELVFTAANTVTVVAVQNTTTGETLTYTGSVVAGDVLEFDSEQKTVKKNGVAVNYSGAFPTLEVGTNVVSYTVTATSFSMDATAKYKPTYL